MTNAPHANINDNDYIHHKLSWFSHHLQNDIGNHTMIYMYIVNILINIALTRFPGWKWGLIFFYSQSYHLILYNWESLDTQSTCSKCSMPKFISYFMKWLVLGFFDKLNESPVLCVQYFFFFPKTFQLLLLRGTYLINPDS